VTFCKSLGWSDALGDTDGWVVVLGFIIFDHFLFFDFGLDAPFCF